MGLTGSRGIALGLQGSGKRSPDLRRGGVRQPHDPNTGIRWVISIHLNPAAVEYLYVYIHVHQTNHSHSNAYPSGPILGIRSICCYLR